MSGNNDGPQGQHGLNFSFGFMGNNPPSTPGFIPTNIVFGPGGRFTFFNGMGGTGIAQGAPFPDPASMVSLAITTDAVIYRRHGFHHYRHHRDLEIHAVRELALVAELCGWLAQLRQVKDSLVVRERQVSEFWA